MRLPTFVLLLVVGSLVVGEGAAGNDQKRKRTSTPSVGMKIKLDISKSLLAGLTSRDFATLVKSGKKMQELNAIEEQARGQSRHYRIELNQFRYATRHLVQAAKQKNLDGVTLAYTEMTISCVNCHKLLRK